jgi:hypothetical protein
MLHHPPEELIRGFVAPFFVDVGHNHFAPSSAYKQAIARPIPEPAPVIRATFLANHHENLDMLKKLHYCLPTYAITLSQIMIKLIKHIF